uniref:Methyltransferase n=1 Tax=Pseudo-nitzschia multistriata TaxID=183589 RepID=A0A448Z0J9_9STRA
MMDVSEENIGNESSVASTRKRRHLDSCNGDNTSTVGVLPANPLASSLETLERAQSPNFEELARQYPRFREAWTATKDAQRGRGQAAFSSCVTQEFTVELTRAILQALFRLKLPYLDEQHLCPPIPNRFFYLHWIHTKLISSSRARGFSPLDVNRNNNSRGLDIGSGASCIYALLAARYFRSKMLTSEIDPQSVSLACANVKANHLSSMITVLQVPHSQSQQEEHARHQPPNSVSVGGPLQCAVGEWFQFQQQKNNQHQKLEPNPCRLVLDFVMTNPPFYDPSSMELSTARVGDGRARTNMTVSEGNYPGGEVGFVTEMIEDSLRMSIGDKESRHFTAAWYSSMLGKKTSLVKLQKLLVHLFGPANVETAEYGPGHYTRWFLAWTLEQPPVAAIAARCAPNASDSFEVLVAAPPSDSFRMNGVANVWNLQKIATKEVVDRISAFCDSSPGGWDLTTTVLGADRKSPVVVVRMTENMPPAVTNFVDEGQRGVEIPESILRILRRRSSNAEFLPAEGHFLVEAEIRTMNARDSRPPSNVVVQVQLSCYRHSARGAKAIEKIRNSLGGEVCRTNRKWRKIRQRQHQAS